LNINSLEGRLLLGIASLLLVACVFCLGLSATNPLSAQTREGSALNSIAAGTFRFNDRYTTPFGPAYADIWLVQSNFLACRPPVGRPFSYALCYFSGPAVGTPVPTDGTAAVNPPLPCILSPDGSSAKCTCYEITTEQYPPYIPYFVSINAILNLNLYLRTVAACGHDGELCSPQPPTANNTWWNPAPVCRAANANDVIPGAELISVFSSVKNADYVTGTTPNSTSCSAGAYAGCMTAPCRYTGRQDDAGNQLVECACPVFNGPYELGQAGVPCDANELTPSAAQNSLPTDASALQNARLTLARGRQPPEYLDPATVEAALAGAGADPSTIQALVTGIFSPTADRAVLLAQYYSLINVAYSSLGAPPVYVWSAAHNPRKNHPPIDPPATGCLPDVGGDKGCPLYSSSTQYPVAKGSPLCRKVCEAYRTGTRESSSGSPSRIQVGYSCDATLCTTLGIGQTVPPPANPLGKARLLKNACGGLDELSGLEAILALEQIDQCSCCASQVCGCANPGTDIDATTQAEIARLNAEQEQLDITPQCQINGTLCGAQTP
jgi:hypothetical protein